MEKWKWYKICSFFLLFIYFKFLGRMVFYVEIVFIYFSFVYWFFEIDVFSIIFIIVFLKLISYFLNLLKVYYFKIIV